MKILFAFLATTVTWLVTALGCATVLFFKNNSKNLQNIMLGFSSGIMIAASFWSLINPAIDLSGDGFFEIIPVALGIVCGVVLMILSDKAINYLEAKEKISFNNNRLLMLIISITIHNIPEGLAVGVAFGGCSYNGKAESLIPALIVALGIAIQNFPEGAAISLPMLNFGYSKKKSFLVGQLSAIVEPVFGVVGALLVVFVGKILPFCLSFAAGCMIYVVTDELIPASSNDKNHLSAISFMTGFLIMMILDVTI